MRGGFDGLAVVGAALGLEEGICSRMQPSFIESIKMVFSKAFHYVIPYDRYNPSITYQKLSKAE